MVRSVANHCRRASQYDFVSGAIETKMLSPGFGIVDGWGTHVEVVEQQMNLDDAIVAEIKAAVGAGCSFDGWQPRLRSDAGKAASLVAAAERLACLTRHANRLKQNDVALEIGETRGRAVLVEQLQVGIGTIELRGPIEINIRTGAIT